MAGLFYLMFAPALFWVQVANPTRATVVEPRNADIIVITEARRARRRRKILRRQRLGY